MATITRQNSSSMLFQGNFKCSCFVPTATKSYRLSLFHPQANQLKTMIVHFVRSASMTRKCENFTFWDISSKKHAINVIVISFESVMTGMHCIHVIRTSQKSTVSRLKSISSMSKWRIHVKLMICSIYQWCM